MKLTSRYEHRYNAFIDALYICELCDTDDKEEFDEVVREYGKENGFTAYIDGVEVKTK